MNVLLFGINPGFYEKSKVNGVGPKHDQLDDLVILGFFVFCF